MDCSIQNKILLIAVFAIAITPAYAYNVFTFSVEQPELTIHLQNTPLSNQQKHTALSNIAMQMQSKPAGDLTEFTKVSLSEMSLLYEEESIRARHKHPPTIKKRQKLYRWSSSTLKYAHYLQSVSDSIDIETPIELHIGNAGELLFIINGHPFMISGPLINWPDILEQRIISTICNYKDCDFEFPWLQREPEKKNIIVKAGWRLDEKKQPEYVSNDGLHFIFNDIKNRTHKQEVCLNIIKELKLIAYALKDTSDKGIFVDWNYINIKPDTEDSHHNLIINAFGDAVSVNLIELAKTPELTQLALAWIKAQVESRPYQQYLYADELVANGAH